ncbi:amidohydrolase family protein [Actinoplanes sp. RD1]|uniref:amidohydrolase family protein n=1 Tax=Actinoplanes sp. RD1 TaxID=3064538 RepID=UPI002740416B|nr:amidohydrolase family protein [Actinoplanes sp. RD1]
MSMLFTGGTVVTMDPAVGDLARGDVLVSGEQIVAVGPDLREHPQARGAEIVDTTGRIVSPGFVDTHRHAWQAQLRRSIPDVTDLGAYVMNTLARIAPVYTPHDMYVGTRLAALSALDAGITTMLDFSHNSRTAEHSDAAIRALVDTGIRGVHASMAPHFGDWDKQWPRDVRRLRAEHSSDLVTVRLASLATDEIAGPLLAYGPELAAIARDLGIGVSVDAVFGASSSEAILRWARDGLLGPQLTLIHSTGLTGEAWRAIGDTGTTISLAPTSDAQIGLETAVPAIDEALTAGVRPGLSIDVEVALASDMFTQMRALHAIQRMRAVNGAYGTDAVPDRITTRDVLDFATLQGARTNGLEPVTGSLTPGKQADLLVVNACDINTMPLNDAVGTLVLGADPRNIETVLVAGVPRKSGGRLVGVDIAAEYERVVASRDAILAATAS